MKRFLVFLFAILSFLSSASALVSLVSPVAQQLEPNSSFSLGSIMPGETLELVFSNDDGKNGVWNKVEIAEGSLPSSWIVKEPEVFAESLAISIMVPTTEVEKLQSIRVRLSDARNPLHAQEVSLKVLVKNDLLSASFSPLQESVPLGKRALYKLVLVNNSLAPHTVAVRSSMPSFWFQPLAVTLPPKPNPAARQEFQLEVYPKAYGLKNFSFFVDSALNEKRLASVPFDLLVRPTLAGKFQSALFGFPFFSPNLSPFYFFNALLGSLQ